MSQKYLSGLNGPQKEAVLHTEGPLLIIAGAGAGKTKTITHRIAHLVSEGTPGSGILAVTFTNKAAGEMRERVHRLLGPGAVASPFISTFHSLGVRLLREFSAEAGLPRNFGIWDRDDQIKAVKTVMKEAGTEEHTPRNILGTISREKGQGVTSAEFKDKARSYYERAAAELWRRYDIILEREDALDFDDLLLKTHKLLVERPEVTEKLRGRWKYLTIDEYQDTNRVQYEIARLLTGDRQNICAVGDIDQNIYSWRGADISHLLSFEKTFPGTKVVMLEQNYRSTQTILTVANAVIAKNAKRYDKRLFTNNPTGEAIELFGALNEQEEARFIAQTTRELLSSDVQASEIAVLYRENFQSRALEEEFITLGIPYRVLGTRFFDRAEVRDVLAYLRAAVNPKSRNDIARAAASPPRGIGKQTLEKLFAGGVLSGAAHAKITAFKALLASIKKNIDTVPASKAVRCALVDSGLERNLAEGSDEDKERLENVRELISLAMKYDSLSAPQGIEHLLEDAALMSEQDSLDLPAHLPAQAGQKAGAVSLMTVHASKGLEFDAIFVTGLEQGLFPSVREDTRDPEEERRLFYVALTRARKHLYLTYAMSRFRFGTRDFGLPSEFLDDIDPRLMSKMEPAYTMPPKGKGLLDFPYDEDAIS